jgi:hypothetical protein
VWTDEPTVCPHPVQLLLEPHNAISLLPNNIAIPLLPYKSAAILFVKFNIKVYSSLQR